MTKTETYRELYLELSGLLTDDWLSNLSNFSSAVFNNLPDLNWCGFYLVRESFGPNHLKLGPFMGRPACLDIPFHRGVCGQSASTRAAVLVKDVHAFPGHIACDERSRSELVVPVVANGKLIGVFDMDSPTVARFDSTDAEETGKLIALLNEKTKWPNSI